MDICEGCGNDLFIERGTYSVKDDDTPEKTTRLFHDTLVYCANPQCSRHNVKFKGAPVSIEIKHVADMFCGCGALLVRNEFGKATYSDGVHVTKHSEPNIEILTCGVCGETSEVEKVTA